MQKMQPDADIIAARYARAVERLPINAARPGNTLEGYWISERQFYFLAEHLDAPSGRILCVPTVADTATGEVAPAIALDALAALIAAHTGTPVAVADLADAGFDMPGPGTLSVSLRDHALLVDLAAGTVSREETPGDKAELYSPDGRHAISLDGHDLRLRCRLSGTTRALTSDGQEHFAYGRDSEASLSVIEYRKRPRPIGLWSQNSEWFVTQRVDERLVPELALVQHAPPQGGRPLLHRYRYSLPGDPRPIVTYVAIHIASGRMITTESFPSFLHIFSDFELRHLWFSSDGRSLFFLQLDQFQACATLIAVDLETGSQHELVTETAPAGYSSFHTRIAEQPNVRLLEKSSEIVWYSDRDGWAHLYLYDQATGVLKAQLTKGEWMVRDIVHVDEAGRRIFFLAGGMDPAAEPGKRSLCAVSLDGGDAEILLQDTCDLTIVSDLPAGFGQDRPFAPSYAPVGASADGRYVVVRRSDIDVPTRASIVDLATGEELALATAMAPEPPRRTPLPFETIAADGVTRLHGTLFFPSDFNPDARYPLVDYIYPGPQTTMLPRAFGTFKEAVAQALAELGFVVMMMDSRGVPFRSRDFHQAGGGRMLEPQLADHAAVVRQLCDRHAYLDPSRIGMTGNSGGGYATARALLDYPDIFKVGVSVSGNHDSRLYHASWLEKYAGPEAAGKWEEQASPPRARNLAGKLFLITGDMDDNVHPALTLRLVDSLIAENRDFDLLVVPNGAHDLWTNWYVQRRAWDYLVEHLAGLRPPANFEIRFNEADIRNHAGIRRREAFPG